MHACFPQGQSTDLSRARAIAGVLGRRYTQAPGREDAIDIELHRLKRRRRRLRDGAQNKGGGKYCTKRAFCTVFPPPLFWTRARPQGREGEAGSHTASPTQEGYSVANRLSPRHLSVGRDRGGREGEGGDRQANEGRRSSGSKFRTTEVRITRCPWPERGHFTGYVRVPRLHSLAH